MQHTLHCCSPAYQRAVFDTYFSVGLKIFIAPSTSTSILRLKFFIIINNNSMIKSQKNPPSSSSHYNTTNIFFFFVVLLLLLLFVVDVGDDALILLGRIFQGACTTAATFIRTILRGIVYSERNCILRGIVYSDAIG